MAATARRGSSFTITRPRSKMMDSMAVARGMSEEHSDEALGVSIGEEEAWE